MSKCTILAHVRTSNGKVVESNLFKDLLSYLPNRGLAKEYYSVGTNKKFLDKVRNEAKFDENGEITFNSLRKLAKIDVEQDKILSTLNKQIGSGTYDYNQAIAKLQSFNRNSGFKEDFMATIKYNNEGKYKLSVVPRTNFNETELHEEIRKRSLQERLMYYLNKAGVSVSFMEKDDKVGGVYSTVNAQKTADGLYQLIKVVNGEKIEDNLAEEAGHFVIGALGDSPLVKRLMELLTPEVQREALGDEFDNKILGPDGRREVAGALVGKALLGNIDNRKPWQRIINRIVDLAKRIFSTFSNKDNVAYKATLEAKEIADKLALNFMSNNFNGSVENTLNTRETLYNAQSSINVQLYRDVVNRLKLASEELEGISNDEFAKSIKNIIAITESGKRKTINSNTVFSDNMALSGITEALSLIADYMGPGKEIDSLLKSINFQDIGDFMSNVASNGKKLRQVHTFITLSLALQQIISDACVVVEGGENIKEDINNVQLINSMGQIVNVNLHQILNYLAEANKTAMAELFNKERQFFCRFCENVLGSKYVNKSAQVLFSKKGKWGLAFEAAKTVKISDALVSMENDITFFERYLASMANNSDLIGAICDKATKNANKLADDLTEECQNSLRLLEERFKKLGFKSTNFLFERSKRSNKLTGNIISPVCWGDYEDDWKEFKKQEFEKFKNTIPNPDELTEFEKGILWDRYFRPLSKSWHKTHSKWSKSLNRYVPNDTYKNSEFDKLMSNAALKEWYDDYMSLKTDLDARLPEGSTLNVRMPQFKGRFINRVKNQDQNLIKSIGHAIRGKIMDTFCESSEDTDYGSDQTYNSEEEELFENVLEHEKEKIHRLPLFGINKLQDMTELSTDLFQSTLAYASMANSHLAMSQIVDTLEVGKNVLANRKVAGQFTESQRTGNKSNAYNRYIKFIDKQVYSISNTKHKIGKKVVLEKILSTLSGLASAYFLGGNVIGGAVNTMTGFNEIFKEMLSGEYFDFKDWTKALTYYFGSFVDKDYWADLGKDVKNNKLALFINHFNTLNTSRQRHRNWENDRSVATRIYNIFGESIYFPYKSGDHFMSSMSFLALANNIKIYDKYGSRISLWDAYKVLDNKDEKGNTAGKILSLDGVYFKEADGSVKYDIINSIISKIENSISSPFGGEINLTQEEQNYINTKGYNISDVSNTLELLKDDAWQLTWNDLDESEFMNKAREINVRLHGIYNNQDKVAFSQVWYGNAVLAMRGYALGMLERRFGANKYSVALGQDVEGTLNTVAKVILSTFTDRGGFKLTTRALLLPFTKSTANALYQIGFSPNQVSNLKRNWGDCLLIALLAIIRSLTAIKDDDDDEDVENSIALGLCYYFSNRLYREQSAFNNPIGWYYEANTILDMVPAGFSALLDIGRMAFQIGGAPFADEANSTFYYQSSKKGLYEAGDSKGINHFMRRLPYIRSLYQFSNPYEAARSYEYGRNVKAR